MTTDSFLLALAAVLLLASLGFTLNAAIPDNKDVRRMEAARIARYLQILALFDVIGATIVQVLR